MGVSPFAGSFTFIQSRPYGIIYSGGHISCGAWKYNAQGRIINHVVHISQIKDQ
jgi:hypothetical protein